VANLTRRRQFYTAIATTCVAIIAFTVGISSHGLAFITSDFVSAPGQFAANHGASIVELIEGNLFVCWYAGSEEKAADVQIYCSRRYGPTNAWTAPQAVVKSGETASNGWLANKTLGNAALYRGNGSSLWLFYTATTLVSGWSGSHVAYKISMDSGTTWSTQGNRITNFWGNLIRNKPIAWGDSQILLPLYHELLGQYGFICAATIQNKSIAPEQCERIPGRGHLQPALVRLPDGSLAAYLRNAKSGQLLVSIAPLGSLVWSSPTPTNLANPNSAVDVIGISEGRILIIYNSSRSGRNVLSVAISQDGYHFSWIRDLENAPGAGGFSYPSILQDRQGLWHVVYTYQRRAAIKHVAFDKAWLGIR